MAEAPPILSDAWAMWVVDKLTSDGETALTDGDIATIISNPNADTRNVLNTLLAESETASAALAKVYTDTVAAALNTSLGRSIANGDIQSVSFAKSYADSEVTKALAAAMAYTDAHSGTGGVSQTYVDNGDASTLTGAKAYTDTGVAGAKTFASAEASAAASMSQTYTDDQLADYLTKAAYDTGRDSIVTDATNAAATMDANTLLLAKQYTDAHGSGGVTTDYVDSQVNEARADFTGQLNTAVQDAKIDSDAFTNAAVDSAATAISATVDGKVEAVRAYADDSDVNVLNAAKAYTDQQGGGGSGGVTQGYVDSGDAETLSSARSYAETQGAQALAGAKLYADGKPTKPSTGWAKADLSDSVQLSLNQADTALQLDDTGWVSVTPIAGYTTRSTVSVRRKNGEVRVKGVLYTNTSGTPMPNVPAVLNIPTGFRPEGFKSFTCPGVGLSITKVGAYANGNVDITAPSSNTEYIALDGLSWFTV